MKTTQRISKLTATLKEHPGFVVLLVLFVIAYLIYVTFFSYLTYASYVNLLLALTIFFAGAGFLYYIFYRWVQPEITKIYFHRMLCNVVMALLLSTGISIWFVQSTEIFPSFLDLLVHVVGISSLELEPMFYPVLTMYLISLLLTPVFWLSITVFEKFWRRKDGLNTRRLQQIALPFSSSVSRPVFFPQIFLKFLR